MSKKVILNPDAFLKVCPSRAVLSRVGQKWTVLVMVALEENTTKRFGDLRRRLEGISQKMLTVTLRAMERDGLIQRNAFDEKPIRVEYGLTSLGRTLLPIVLALKQWAEESMLTIERNNCNFDCKLQGECA
jgi:DNA-binding HxlR family transcriptional regulator